MTSGGGPVRATIYDGLHPIGRGVEVVLRPDRLVIEDGSREVGVPLAAVSVSPRIGTADRFVTLPDDSQLACADGPWLDGLPQEERAEGLVAWLERRWWVALIATCASALFVLYVWRFGLDRAADIVAARISDESERRFGVDAIAALDHSLFQPTKVDSARRQAVIELLARLEGSSASTKTHTLVFRDSKRMGANAAALPGKFIVITDRLLTIENHDAEVMAVLAHELGHSLLGHTRRGFVRSSINAAIVSFLTGDFAAFNPGARAARDMIVDAHRRDQERDADAFAFVLLCRAGTPPDRFASALERLTRDHLGDQPEPWGFLGSHPRPSERAAAARAYRCAP